MRDFLWNKWSHHYLHPVAWDSICRPFSSGVLNIISFVGTSRAALLRQLWNVVQNKPTCWNIWLNAKYLKGKSFWDVSIPKAASWRWKGILALRRIALPQIKFLVGSGHVVKFWTDPWLNGGRLQDRFGGRAIYDLRLGVDVKLHQFIVNHKCDFLVATSNALMDIFRDK